MNLFTLTLMYLLAVSFEATLAIAQTPRTEPLLQLAQLIPQQSPSAPIQPAPGVQPMQPSPSIQLSNELKTLQGVQRLEEKVLYMETLLKALNAKVDAAAAKIDAVGQQYQQITSQLATHPAQHRILAPSQRWEIVLNGMGVLDRETGLVWEHSPSTHNISWRDATEYCPTKEMSRRSGWRLPTIQELASLAPLTGSPFASLLRPNPPFVPSSGRFWSSTISHVENTTFPGPVDGTVSFNEDRAYSQFQPAESPGSGSQGPRNVWCVRGSSGHN